MSIRNRTGLARYLVLGGLLLPLLAVTACSPSAPNQAETSAQAANPAAASAQPANTTSASTQSGATTTVGMRPYPHAYTVAGTTFQIHQPQVERWSGDQLTGQAVMSVDTGTRTGTNGKQQVSHDYGVLDFTARTQIDKDASVVKLTDLQITKASFPTATAKQQRYLALVRQLLHSKSQSQHSLAIPLAQLEAALAISSAREPAKSLPVRNDPPDILFTTKPAVLILVQGQPALKPSGVAGVRRVINTRSLLLKKGGTYYTLVAGHWASAPVLAGPWAPLAQPGSALVKAAKVAADTHLVETLDNPPKALKAVFAAGHWPEVFVRTHPAELIAVEGDPQFAAIPGTHLSYVTNTGADVFVDAAAGNAWYVLISGRWFTATTTHGPWSYVAPGKLPVDFTQIPADSPKSAVLASIPGTPQAKESLIANSIPQTATVKRDKAKLSVHYDGTPDFVPVAGTTLRYARNTPVPVIRVSAHSYYAVDKGIWFVATWPKGPWVVALSVPAVIYSIPVASPLHYVTYVYVYGYTGSVVYTGYAPGYYGTVVTNNVVVYGTGYPCNPWVGVYWYGCPATYGMGAYFGYSPWVGWTFGWGWGWYAGWYGPYNPWWGPWHGPVYPYGWWGGGAAAWNVYGHWGNATIQGTVVAWNNPWTGNYGYAKRGGYYNDVTGARGAGRDIVNTNAYTGTTRAAGQEVHYNPQTGRAVAGEGHAAANPYTGQAGAAGRRATYNTNTGQATRAAGGAAGGATFNSHGEQGNAKGAGGFKYNANTGTLNHGGAADVNGNIYAGHDGNVYEYEDGQWNKLTKPDASGNLGGQTRDQPSRPDASGNLSGQTQKLPSNLDQDRTERQRGDESMTNDRTPRRFNRGGSSSPPSGLRPSLGGGARRGGGRHR